MNQITARMKSIRLGRILTVFLSTMLILVSTACNSGGVLAKNADQVREEVPGGAVTSPYKGGMNDYSDVDPRKDTSEAQAKAKSLIDSTKRQVIDQTDDVGTNTKRILDKKGENARDFGQNVKENAEDLGDKVKSSAQDFVKGTRQGTENIKDNTGDAVRGTRRAAEDAKDNAKEASRDFAKGTNRAAERTGIKSAAENVKDNTEDASQNLVDKAKEAAAKAAGYIQGKAD